MDPMEDDRKMLAAKPPKGKEVPPPRRRKVQMRMRMKMRRTR